MGIFHFLLFFILPFRSGRAGESCYLIDPFDKKSLFSGQSIRNAVFYVKKILAHHDAGGSD
jgi:hypothetical protein